MGSQGDTTCGICCDTYTDARRARVRCAHCDYVACNACYRQYITSSMQDAHCMQCRNVWSRDVLATFFPTAWMNGDYKRHRERVLVGREKQLLPESQALVANYREATMLRDGLKEKAETARALKLQHDELTRQIWNDRYRAERLEARHYAGDMDFQRGGAGGERSQRRRVDFVTPCPVDACRGFVTLTKLGVTECGTCKVVTCSDCGVALPPADPDTDPAPAHVCVENDKASFQAIKMQTRPCPKCAVPTFRVSGCNQMWCTSCQTAWDWTTGEIARGVIHNPHYFAYLRTRAAEGEDIPRQPGDDGRVIGNDPAGACRRQRHMPTGWDVTRRIRAVVQDLQLEHAGADLEQARADAKEVADDLLTLQQKFVHVNRVVLPGLRVPAGHAQPRPNDNADLRLKYLINKIDDAGFQAQLQRREKRRDKDVALHDIYTMACDVCRDSLHEFIDGNKSLDETLKDLQAIQTYANDNLLAVRERLHMTVHMI